MEYTVVFETPLDRNGNYSGFVPDVPGCVSTGCTLVDVRMNLHEALLFYLEDMKDTGERLPTPVTTVGEAEIEFGKDYIVESMEASSHQILRMQPTS